MPLSPGDLEAFAGRARDHLSGNPNRRVVGLRVVEPLLEVLGWDLRGPEIDPEVDVAGRRVDYLCCVAETPCVAVVVRAGEAPVAAGGDSTARSVCAAGAVDRAIETDGSTFLLAARADGAVHTRRVAIDDLAEETTALEGFTRRACARRVERRSTASAARDRLADRRSDAVDRVTEAVVDVAGESLEEPARDAAEEFVGSLVDDGSGRADAGAVDKEASSELRAGRGHEDIDGSTEDGTDATGGETAATGTGTDSDGTESDQTERGGDANETGGTETDAAGSDSTSADDARPTTSPPSVPDSSASAEDGEYVARFFEGSSSVGAVGTNTPGGALAGAVRYLAENHGLVGSITLQWRDDGRGILIDDPGHAGGSPADAYDQVAPDLYVWTGGGVACCRSAIEALAEAVGLRVMFQGDW